VGEFLGYASGGSEDKIMVEIDSSSTSYVVYQTQKANNFLGSQAELMIRLWNKSSLVDIYKN
jgi:hypothetical protein